MEPDPLKRINLYHPCVSESLSEDVQSTQMALNCSLFCNTVTKNSKIMNFIVLLQKALSHKGLKQLFMIFYFELYFVLNFIFSKLIVQFL